MLLYVDAVEKELDDLQKHADGFRIKFRRSRKISNIKNDVALLHDHAVRVTANLPDGVGAVGSLNKHLNWLSRYVNKNENASCESDVADICDRDIAAIRKAFRNWCNNNKGLDAALEREATPLLRDGHFSEAANVAFKVLSDRMRDISASKKGDGEALINELLAGKSPVVTVGTDAERQGLRNLLSGLYACYRNRYAHNVAKINLREADGIISLVNELLWRIENINSMMKANSP